MEISEGVVVPGTLEFSDPFEFFELPFDVQYDFLLKADLGSIRNLCAAAALSKYPGAVEFFEEMCGGYRFWKRKLRQDFPGDYPRLLREAEIIEEVDYWRRGYGNLFREAGARMIAAARVGDTTTTLRYLDLGVDPNTRDGYGNTALMAASSSGRLKTVQTLLERGFDPNAENQDGETSLMYASTWGKLLIVQELLEAGADPNMQNKDHWTALIFASSEDHFEVVQSLLSAGANIDAQNDERETALIWAVIQDYGEIVRILLEAGADIEIENDEEETALDIASERGYHEIVEMIKSFDIII